MSHTVLLAVLFCSLAAGIIALFVLLTNKKDNKRFEKITAIASFMTSIATIVVGIVTITVMKHEEDNTKLQFQPLLSISYEKHDNSLGQYTNEEYTVTNVGYKMKNRPTIICSSYLRVTYYNPSMTKSVTKYCPIEHFFNVPECTGSLDGIIAFSSHSGNNYEYLDRLYSEVLEYPMTHHGVVLFIEDTHYFDIFYTDIYGDQHRMIKLNDFEKDPDDYRLIIQKANRDSGNTSFSLSSSHLEDLL